MHDSASAIRQPRAASSAAHDLLEPLSVGAEHVLAERALDVGDGGVERPASAGSRSRTHEELQLDLSRRREDGRLDRQRPLGATRS